MMEEVGMIMAMVGVVMLFAANTLLHLEILSDTITLLSVTAPMINLVAGFGMMFLGAMLTWTART